LTFFLGTFVVFSAGLWYVYVVAMHQFTPDFLPNASTVDLFKSPVFWALVTLIPVAVVLRDFLWKFCRRQFFPHPYHIVQELKYVKPPKEGGKAKKSLVNLIFEGANKKPKLNRGFSFSQTFGQTKILHAYGQSPKLSSSLRNE
jgi:phospholipid-transporting ATPase